MNTKGHFLVWVILFFSFFLAIPTAWACKVMGEVTQKRTRAEDVCRRECSFHGGWSGRMDGQRKGLGVKFVDCYCNNEPANALCQ